MKLAIIIVILAFCYCGSCAYILINPLSLLQPEEVDLQPRPRLLEPGYELSRDVREDKNKSEKTVGYGNRWLGQPPRLKKREEKVPASTPEITENSLLRSLFKGYVPNHFGKEKKEINYKVGFGNSVRPRRRNRKGEEEFPLTAEIKESFENSDPRMVLKPEALRLLQEYYGEPEYVGDYDVQN